MNASVFSREEPRMHSVLEIEVSLASNKGFWLLLGGEELFVL